MKNFLYLFFILLVSRIIIFADYEETFNLNQLVFPILTVKSSHHTSAIFIDNSYSTDDLSRHFKKLQKYMHTYQNRIFPVLIDSSFTKMQVIDSLIDVNNLSNNIIDDYESVKSNINNNKRLLLLEIKNNNYFHILNFTDLTNQYSMTNLDSLVEFSEIAKPVFNFWHRTGKLPNFILTDNINEYMQLISIADTINNYPRIQGNVIYDHRPLNNIKWLEFPGLTTSGKFSIPIHKSHRIFLSPDKDGFKFSPDIVCFTALTFNNEKIFQAYLMDINNKMVADFPFDGEINNLCNTDNDKLLIQNIQFVNDSERGKVAKFNGKNSYIDCDKTIQIGNSKQMTLSIWVKADRISENHAFIGKGLDFSFKIREKNPTFTTAKIKDHSASYIFADSTQWQHIAIVVKENENVKFYINGEFKGLVAASEIKQSNNSLMIGTNLWDEFYSGYMDDLKLWNRALNDLEIMDIFNNDKIKKKNNFTNYAIIIILLFFVFVIYKIKIQLPKKSIKVFPKSIDVIHIDFFGGFKITNNISDNSHNNLSPKTKHILILLLIKTVKQGGISTKIMTELLWQGFSVEKAKNNKSTYIRKLRTFLKDFKGIEIIHENKKWQINLPENVKFDYEKFIELINDPETLSMNTKTNELIKIISKGQFLPEIEIDWLDDYRLDITNKLDNFLKEYQKQNNIRKNPGLTFTIASEIRKFDPINETALALQIQSQINLGNHSFAKKCYDTFIKDYKMLYNENFPKKFQDFI